MRIVPHLGALSLIALLALGYPLCVWTGLDGAVAWLSNGSLPAPGELAATGIVLGARVAQWLLAPILGLSYALWLVLARLTA